jgi:hypothetical protein
LQVERHPEVRDALALLREIVTLAREIPAIAQPLPKRIDSAVRFAQKAAIRDGFSNG